MVLEAGYLPNWQVSLFEKQEQDAFKGATAIIEKLAGQMNDDGQRANFLPAAQVQRVMAKACSANS